MTDKEVEKAELVTHKRYGLVWKIPVGHLAVGVDSMGRQGIGIVESWNLSHSHDSWGCTMRVNGLEFYPDSVKSLRPLTKLERALR